jgi:membrane-associated phospholipid phosphatase
VDGDCFHFFSLLPVFFIFILFRLGRVSNLNLEVKEQRTLPLLFVIGAACIGLGIFYVIGAPREIIWAGIAYIANGVIFGAITQVWKISFHTGVFTGCVTVLVLILHDARFAWLFLLVPLIAWARVRRKRHTLVQTVVGALIALINTVVVLRLCVEIGLGS